MSQDPSAHEPAGVSWSVAVVHAQSCIAHCRGSQCPDHCRSRVAACCETGAGFASARSNGRLESDRCRESDAAVSRLYVSGSPPKTRVAPLAARPAIHPAGMQTPPCLRVKWQVKPRASGLLDGLRQRVEIAPEVLVSEDFSDLRQWPPEQPEKRLRELNERGQTIAAVYMARMLYGCELAEATKSVQGLRKESQP